MSFCEKRPLHVLVHRIDVKNVFCVFYSCHVFLRFFNVFYFPYVFKIKNVGNLLSTQAHSENFNFSYATFLNSKLVKLWEFNQ